MEFGTLTAYQGKLLLTIFLIESGAGLWLWRWLTAKGSARENDLSQKARDQLYLYVLFLTLLLVKKGDPQLCWGGSLSLTVPDIS